MMTTKSINKARLYIEYKAVSDNPAKNIKAGDVTFAVYFNGYITPLFFEGRRASCATADAPLYIRVSLRHCTHLAKSSDYFLTIDDRINFEDDPRVEVLTGCREQEVYEMMVSL